MPETFTTRYAALVAAGKIEADPGQAMLARHLAHSNSGSISTGWPANRHRSAGCSASGNRRETVKGLYVYGEVGRGKTMLMDLFFETSAVDPQAARPFPRIHGRRARARSCLSAGDQERRSQRAGSNPAHGRRNRGGKLAPVLRRIPRDRYCRRDDPRPTVYAAVRARRRHGRDIEFARQATFTRTASIARCSCRLSRCWNANARWSGLKRASIFVWRNSPACRPGMCRTTPKPKPRSTMLGGAWLAIRPASHMN